jgi:hypothetical protein
MRRAAVFLFAFVVISLLWLVFEVPHAIRYWFEDRWYFIRDLWRSTASDGVPAVGVQGSCCCGEPLRAGIVHTPNRCYTRGVKTPDEVKRFAVEFPASCSATKESLLAVLGSAHAIHRDNIKVSDDVPERVTAADPQRNAGGA